MSQPHTTQESILTSSTKSPSPTPTSTPPGSPLSKSSKSTFKVGLLVLTRKWKNRTYTGVITSKPKDPKLNSNSASSSSSSNPPPSPKKVVERWVVKWDEWENSNGGETIMNANDLRLYTPGVDILSPAKGKKKSITLSSSDQAKQEKELAKQVRIRA